MAKFSLCLSITTLSTWTLSKPQQLIEVTNSELKYVYEMVDPRMKRIRVYPKVSGLAAWSENCK
jgi:hypothetical protein